MNMLNADVEISTLVQRIKEMIRCIYFEVSDLIIDPYFIEELFHQKRERERDRSAIDRLRLIQSVNMY